MRVDLCERPSADWSAFVDEHPDAVLGHAPAWCETLARGYRLETRYLAARRESGALCGVLPLARIHRLAGGHEWVSLPFLDSAGALAADPLAERALVERALELARESGARALELRFDSPRPDATSAAHRVDLVLDLEGDEETQWKALSAKVRNQTRKAGRSGLSVGTDPDAALAAFYQPFCTNMRDLGSPVHGKQLFAAMAHAFGDQLEFITALDGERPVGGLVAIRFGDTVSVPWASTLRSERARCPNNLIYWEAIRRAVAGGARRFDFGRSPPNSGTYRFKRGWGARERALGWVRFRPDGAELSLDRPGDSAPLQWMSRIWRRLPVAVANRLGPVVRRRISA